MGDAVITSFRRYEVKYFLTTAQYRKLLTQIAPHMSMDAYGYHTISNIFFDTDQFEITRASIEKPKYKEKLRVRAYGVPEKDVGQVFVELKKKYQGVVYKRRIALPIAAAHAFLLNDEIPQNTDPQITGEIAYFMRRYHPKPKVFLSYDRVAYYDREDDELRITFDRNLRWRDTDLNLCSGAYGEPILPDDRILMEIKVPGTMPLWLAQALSELSIFSTSFSKIGRCYTEHILPKIFTKKAVNENV